MTLPRLLAFDVAPYPPDPIEVVESAVEAPIWFWAVAGSCCMLSALGGVLVLAGLVWLLHRRRKQ